MKIILSDNALSALLNFRGEIAKMLLDEGHSVTFVAPCDPHAEGMEIPAGARYIPVPLARTGTNPLDDVRYLRRLGKIYRAEEPDHIFHYTIKPNVYGTLAAHWLGIRSTAVIPGLGHVYERGGVGNLVARALYRFALRWADNVVVLNAANRDTYIARIETHAARKPRLWLWEGGEGVDLEHFSRRLAPRNDRPVFLMVARLLYEKGYTEYVTAARELRGKAEFRLMGPLDTHASAVSAATLEQDKEWIRYIPRDPDAREQIAHSDCVVLPSWHEGLSRVLMEGAAMDRPLIASDIAGCREAIDDGVNGLLVKPKDAASLTATCRFFISLPRAERAKMGTASRRLAEAKFDVRRVFDHYRAILNEK